MSQLGWEVGKNLFMAPFDWRVPSFNQSDFHAQLQTLVETTVKSTGQKVTLMALSEGPQVTLSFLHRMTQEWKDTHVAWFVANSPVWSGAPMSLMSAVSGINTTSTMSFELGRQLSLNTPSFYWLWPRLGDNATITWPADEPLLLTPSRVYTAANMSNALRDLGLDAYAAVADIVTHEPDMTAFAPPGVNTFVTYGTQIPTPATYSYDRDFAPQLPSPPQPSLVGVTSGDSVVTLRSSLRGLTWTDAMAAAGHRLVHKEYPKQQHAFCLFSDVTCLHDVLRLITSA